METFGLPVYIIQQTFETVHLVSGQVEYFKVAYLGVQILQDFDLVIGQVQLCELTQPVQVLYTCQSVVTQVQNLHSWDQLLKYQTDFQTL